MKIFGFDLEFDHNAIRDKISRCKDGNTKGYVCIVDGPSLARSYQEQKFMDLLQHAYFNSCDGGTIAVMASRLYKRELRAFTGPEIFAEFIVKTEYNHILLGNTEEMYNQVCDKVKSQVGTTDHMQYIPLPFATVENFDYEGIAKDIESRKADLIWVSLGAPKQEYFMQLLEPHLKRGVMLGVGAAFAFYIGQLKDYEFRIGEYRFNWLYRILIEPKKQIKRIKTILCTYPIIYLKEKRRISRRG